MDNKPDPTPPTAAELMTEKLETINLLNTPQEAAMKMADRNVSSLAVVDDDDKAIGIVTEGIWQGASVQLTEAATM